ncbi:MAG TPA: hypothetical protein VM029_15195 [Opitutaceae bacterium]|nr:hypothetical protein [Opitutaceae bacterium]
MEGDSNSGEATSHELVLHQLMSLQADIEAIKEAQVLLLKVLVNFPAGQTPQRWLHAVREKAFCDLELKSAAIRQSLPEHMAAHGPSPGITLPRPPAPAGLPRPPQVTLGAPPSSPLRSFLQFVRGRA